MHRKVSKNKNKGYEIQILTSNQPHLGITEDNIRSKGIKAVKYDKGVIRISNKEEEKRRRIHNINLIEEVIRIIRPDCCLIGNLDLLGEEVLNCVLDKKIPTIQHIGFMGSPFEGDWIPSKKPFRVALASGK